MAGTLPNDGTSYFKVRLDKVSGQPTSKNIVFSPRLPTRNYTVLLRTNLTAGAFTPLTGASTNDASQVRTVTDLNATNTARFYRVRIDYP